MDAYDAMPKFKELQSTYGFVPELHILGIHVMRNYIRAMAMAVHEQQLPVNYKELISVYEDVFRQVPFGGNVAEIAFMHKYSKMALAGVRNSDKWLDFLKQKIQEQLSVFMLGNAQTSNPDYVLNLICTLKDSMPTYGDKDYWDQRYESTSGDLYDWLHSFESLRPIFEKYLKPTDKIINLGCGNSSLPGDMLQAGYQSQIGVDYSKIVIKQMKERYKVFDKLRFEVEDVTNLSYSDGTFDVAIDKGTIDTILCNESGFTKCALMLSEATRVLVNDGLYIAISYGDPESRLSHMQSRHLAFDIE